MVRSKPDQPSLPVPLHEGSHNPRTLREDRGELLEERRRERGGLMGGHKIESHPCRLFSLRGPSGRDVEPQHHDLPAFPELTSHNLTGVRFPLFITDGQGSPTNP